MAKTLTDEEMQAEGIENPYPPDTEGDVILAMQQDMDRLTDQIAILSCTHPLFSVYRCGKHWNATYHGKTGRLKLEGCACADEALRAVEGWQSIAL